MNTLKINGAIYRNSLLDIPCSYNELTEFLKQQKLSFDSTRTMEKFPAPSFTMTFYRFIMENDKIPTQTEFCEYFVNSVPNKEHITAKSKSWASSQSEIETGLKARAARTYPSLIRDLAFSMMLKDSGYDTFWNPEVDVDCKADMVINYNDTLYGIAMYTDTKLGNSNRARKLDETEMPSELTKIELPLNLSSGEKVGDFLMYGVRHKEKLLTMLA